MCDIEERFAMLERKLISMQDVIDKGFPTWFEEETRSLFNEKYNKRKLEANDLYRNLLRKAD